MTSEDIKRRHASVANLDEVERTGFGKGKLTHASKRLSKATQGKTLGCTWYEVEPGKAAFPAHYHCATEEAIYVLEGEGTLRIGSERLTVRPGDYIALTTGPDHAHRLDNTGTAPLRYLCISGSGGAGVEVVGYPDSGKIGFSAGTWEKPIVRGLLRNGVETKDYFEGEETE